MENAPERPTLQAHLERELGVKIEKDPLDDLTTLIKDTHLDVLHFMAEDVRKTGNYGLSSKLGALQLEVGQRGYSNRSNDPYDFSEDFTIKDKSMTGGELLDKIVEFYNSQGFSHKQHPNYVAFKAPDGSAMIIMIVGIIEEKQTSFRAAYFPPEIAAKELSDLL